MTRSAIKNVCGACTLTVIGAISARAQAPASTTAADATTNGVYVGGQFGVLGGSSLWSPYDLVDGSGSHFGGFNVGYLHRRPSGVVFGGEADLSFGAEPGHPNGVVHETPELFGTVRGRAGYSAKRWLAYGTGGLAWTRNQLTGDPPPGGTASTTAFRQHIGWTIGAGIERALDARWSANAEYFYTMAGASTNQLRVGFHYILGSDIGSASEPLGISALDIENWNVHGQTTLVSQYAAPFHAPLKYQEMVR